jgi:hypothetical protein
MCGILGHPGDHPVSHPENPEEAGDQEEDGDQYPGAILAPVRVRPFLTPLPQFIEQDH